MYNILINNNFDCHYELIESIINKINFIIKNDTTEYNLYIYVKKYKNIINHASFIEYISEKYPKIILLFNMLAIDFDYTIMCSCYKEHLETIEKNSKKHYYICHDITDENIICENVYHLTPLCKTDRYFYCDMLPYSTPKLIFDIPFYIIQGDFKRRSLKLLLNILNKSYNYNFIIKIVNNNDLPEELEPYSHRILHLKGLNYKEYHVNFCGIYAILPLSTKEEQPYYYSTKLTSSINYARAYDLTIVIDKDLQDIYNMDSKKAYVFNDETDISVAFNKSLEDFYTKKGV